MKNLSRIYISIIAALICSVSMSAQDERPKGIEKSILLGLEYEVNAGLNIGGASPLPLPAEIRKINGYSPRLNLQLGGKVV